MRKIIYRFSWLTWFTMSAWGHVDDDRRGQHILLGVFWKKCCLFCVFPISFCVSFSFVFLLESHFSFLALYPQTKNSANVVVFYNVHLGNLISGIGIAHCPHSTRSFRIQLVCYPWFSFDAPRVFRMTQSMWRLQWNALINCCGFGFSRSVFL